MCSKHRLGQEETGIALRLLRPRYCRGGSGPGLRTSFPEPQARTTSRPCSGALPDFGPRSTWIELDGQSVGANGEEPLARRKRRPTASPLAALCVASALRMASLRGTKRQLARSKGFKAAVSTVSTGSGAHDLQLALGVERGLRVGTHRDDILNFLDVDLFAGRNSAVASHLLLLDGWLGLRIL